MKNQGTVTVLLLGLAFALTLPTAFAQRGSPPNSLQTQLTALEARVAALEGGAVGLRVVDALGQFIGVPVGNGDDVISFIDGHWVDLSVDTDGFVQQASRQVRFVSANCSGSPILNSADILRSGFTFEGQTLQYAGDPIVTLTTNSVGNLQSDGSVTGCFANTGIIRGGPIVQFDLTTLNLTLPFSIAP